MKREIAVLLCWAVAFAAAGFGVMPGMSIGITKFSWYVAGLGMGLSLGMQMALFGWVR